MSDEKVWDHESRNDLRERLREVVVGELRLAKDDHDDILQICREVYIGDECPENERESFIQFAANELRQASSLLTAEKASWPDETDCDRLSRVEAVLRDRGILLWQVSPCCDTCSGAELPDRIDEIDGRHPGFRDRVRGYAFFIEQNMPDMLAKSTHLSVYLAYGWFSPDASDVDPARYEENALGIAHEICDCLREHDFEVNWNGNFDRKIGLSLNWQRRTRLE